MGKGTGNVCGNASVSKEGGSSAQTSEVASVKPPASEEPKVEAAKTVTAAVEEPKAAAAAPVANADNDQTTKIYIAYYSMYGHIEKMARAIKEGVDSIPGVQGILYQVKETLPEEVLEKMYAPAKAADVPLIDAHTIEQADGFIFGFPTRFGMMPAQMKGFFDQTGQQWMKGSLSGKPAGFFTSTGTQHGGQEVTILNAVCHLAHHGMVYVPLGKASQELMSYDDVVHGGSAYGSGTIAGSKGERQPSEAELSVAKGQGSFFAEVAKKLKLNV